MLLLATVLLHLWLSFEQQLLHWLLWQLRRAGTQAAAVVCNLLLPERQCSSM